MSLITLFSRKWSDVPVVVIDTETTGARPGRVHEWVRFHDSLSRQSPQESAE